MPSRAQLGTRRKKIHDDVIREGFLRNDMVQFLSELQPVDIVLILIIFIGAFAYQLLIYCTNYFYLLLSRSARPHYD